jgi:1-acyl-sn-glycerol-3-phosphate acyltransferase
MRWVVPEWWYHNLFRFITAVYFARVTLLHAERLPRSGPVLFLALHRNGAVDGFVYHRMLRRPVFMISTQLRRNWFARLFFHGIAVTRTKDEGDRAVNAQALRQCLDCLTAGGRLAVFPEGTSSLGPRHLPFKSGAIWLLLDYLGSGGPPLQVVPVGIHYECPQAFRGKVEVVVGEPVATDLPAGASQLEQLRILKRRVQDALEGVGINVGSDACQDQIQRLAYGATLATPRSYFASLKAFETAVPEKVRVAAQELEAECRARRLRHHQGVPLFPMGPLALYALLLAVLSPIVLGAVALNLPPFLAGWFAGRKFADDANVVSLWKIMVGVPFFALWMGGLALAALLLGQPLLLAGYLLLTWAGLQLYYRVKKLAVAVHNGLRYPRLRARMLAFRETVLRALPDEAA